jgi:hypothetical protein|tara:strand:- start:2916 stop:3113 length:198 start_codon:yes stop_codon:yes gene_type:complete
MHKQTIEVDTTDHKKLAKLQFIHNALEKGWSVRKREANYVFRKRHNGEIRVFQKSFIEEFVREHL